MHESTTESVQPFICLHVHTIGVGSYDSKPLETVSKATENESKATENAVFFIDKSNGRL